MSQTSTLAVPPVASRTASGGFQTSKGTLYVSKPFRSKDKKKLRALVTFAPRKSAFDISNESSGMNEFRGFFSLFWISIFIWTVQIYVRGIEKTGQPLNLAFATMFSQDALTLALSDGALVLSTGICIPFGIALKKRWINYYWTGLVIQHLIQTTILVSAITWTFNRQWPWVQSGFLTLHCFVMIMKMHSYLAVNGHLQSVTMQSADLLRDLRSATDTVGGWDTAIQVAKVHRAELDAKSMTDSTNSDEPTPIGTPDIPQGSTATYVDASTASALRRRLTKVAMATQGNIDIEPMKVTRTDSDTTAPMIKVNGKGVAPEEVGSNVSSRPPTPSEEEQEHRHVHESHPLVDHPDERIAEIAREYSELQSELTSAGPEYVTWPANISAKNFAMYQLYPTLVYELEYPRTDKIRPLYVFEKTVATFGTFALLYTVTETFILPYVPTAEQSIFRSLLDLALPFMIAYLLLFFIIFECICNGFAELSCFADRQFYEDWWNSTSQGEFSRKWNKPVHTFLLRHVYTPPILGYGVSKTWAMFWTFLLSACVHELVMVIVTKKIRMYLFVLQIVQIPMILVSRIPIVKRNKMLGNLVFWLGLYAGFPLLCVAYVAH